MSSSIKTVLGALALAGAFEGNASAQETKVGIGISGWTGFAPLTLAKEAGIYKANGLDVTIRKIPQKDRHLAIASGDIQCAATTVETWIVWNTNGIPTTQLFKMDQGMGSDGIVARPAINKVTDLKGKTVAASAPGTNPHFTLAWILKKNGLSLKDVKLVTLEPAAAATAFVAGTSDLDAAVTYEPYLSLVRDKPESGKLIADSLQYPMVFDTFGCTPKFIKENPKAAKALTDSYFQAIDLIAKDKQKASPSWAPTSSRRPSSSRSRSPRSSGPTARPTRSSSMARSRPSTRKPPSCCWKSASSRRRQPTWIRCSTRRS